MGVENMTFQEQRECRRASSQVHAVPVHHRNRIHDRKKKEDAEATSIHYDDLTKMY